MGCSSSKVDNEESVRLCKDRKRFIKQAVEYRFQFASVHIAYIQSMKRVSAALRDYVEVDEPREFCLDPFTASRSLPPPVKRVKPSGFISIEPTLRVNYYLRPRGNPSVSVEERPPQTPETFNIHAYSPPAHHQYGGMDDGFFSMRSPPTSNRPDASPQNNSPWDFLWNPFASLDYYGGYPTASNSPGPEILDDDGLRHVRETEGIPDLEEESENEEEITCRESAREDERHNRFHQKVNKEEVLVEDVDDESDDDDSDEVDEHIDTEHCVGGFNSNPNLHTQGLHSNATNHHSQGVNLSSANQHFQGLHSNDKPHFQGSNSNANHHFQGSNLNDNLRFEGSNSNASRHFQNLNPNVIPHHYQGSNTNANHHHAQGFSTNPNNHYHELHPNGNRYFQESNSNAYCDFEVQSSNAERHVQGVRYNANHGTAVARAQNTRHLTTKETAVAGCEPKKEMSGFTVYVNRRPTSMAEVIKELEAQFTIACNSAKEVSSILESIRAQYSPTSNDMKSMKMLNPIALIRSASSRSSSSRFLINPSILKDESYQSNSDISDESSMFSSSHQSTLDRLYIWEKKLYQEVRAGERVRLTYEKKCAQLRNLDVSGADPSTIEKTRATIRDLHTQIKISIHSVQSISKRIESLRDDELQPQLLQLVEGLGKMWKVMAECHHIQKRTLDDAKLLLASTPSTNSRTKKYTIMSQSEPHQLARSAANLEMELRNWRACFESWITSQRSYLQALKGWVLRCLSKDSGKSKSARSPPPPEGGPPIFNVCIQWSTLLDSVRERPVLEGMDFFAAGVGSLYARQMRDDARWSNGGSRRFSGGDATNNMELVEVGRVDGGDDEEEGVMTAEKMAEVAIRVLCAGMSFSVSSLTEFALASAEGYADLIKNWEERNSSRNGNSFTV
ncbi:hypothetical protein DM860_016387 [Cuscuta australis]|uniref:DUF632 domain-containing protein n=1 Tax=Cuscuta australis TaxID=267555 RepID=A0A328DJ04_9ASTE|nr:hypothetical protein DM860_016387 [Cuscuta australis]